MLIETKEQYEEIPDGTRLKVVLVGDGWGEDTGISVDCLKFKDKLYDTPSTFYLFSERNEKDSKDKDGFIYEDYQFLIVKVPGQQYEI